MATAPLTENLFSYGTLQYEKVQLATFGRKLNGKPDVLPGYRLEQLTITDPAVLATSGETSHPVAIHTGNPDDTIHGMVFAISTEELAYSDEYEVSDYRRVPVQLDSGITAWSYVKNQGSGVSGPV